MKKTNFVTLLIVFLFILFIPEGKLYPQVKSYSSKFKPPIVTVELLFSYPHPLPDLSGNLSEFFTFQKFGVQNGIIGSQINVKLSAEKKGRIRPYMSLGYSLFYGSDKNTAFIDTNYVNGYPPGGSTLYNSTPGSSELYLHSFLAGAGFEYAFMNRTKWTPHLEAEFDMNILFGTYRQTPTLSKGAPGEVSFTIREAVRFGFGVGGGVQMRLTRAFGLGFTTKYKFSNLLGKDSERFAEVNKLSLNDKSAPDLNKYLNKDRNIQYVEFMLGMVFFIERK